MYRNIVVPYDGSQSAGHALPWALSLAQHDRAIIRLVRVHLSPSPILVGNEVVADFALDQTIREQEGKALDELAQRLAQSSTCKIRWELLDGSIASSLSEYVETVQADLVVMTSHGRGPVARFWLGSVADQFVRSTSCPTLIVRPTDQAVDLNTRPFIKHLVVPLDGSSLAEQILEPAIALGQMVGADFTLLMVLDAVSDISRIAGPVSTVAPSLWQADAVRARAEHYLEENAERMRQRSLKVHSELIEHGSAAETIVNYAQQHGNAVIALATHGRGGINRLMFGSVADKVIRAASMPVLVFHPKN